MAKRFRLRISRILQSCGPKDPSSLPSNPIPSFLRRHVSKTHHISEQAKFEWGQEDKYWHVVAATDSPRRKICASDDAVSGLGESVAVVKRSVEPLEDFKRSMKEMIEEKEMYSEEELEHLLQCFLTLNSRDHRWLIVQAFTEIWEAIFCI